MFLCVRVRAHARARAFVCLGVFAITIDTDYSSVSKCHFLRTFERDTPATSDAGHSC